MRHINFNVVFNFSRFLVIVFVFIAQFIETAHSTIIIDGELTEPEWTQAQTLDEYSVVIPFSLEQPRYSTKTLVYSDEFGLYFGFINQQPEESRDRRKSNRDMLHGDYDRNIVAIDFDNKGNTGYMLGISLGGSLLDFAVTNETQTDGDWDGEWYAKTSESKENWYSEFFIPWALVSMKKQEGSTRKIRVGFSRGVQHLSQTYGLPEISPMRTKFLSLFIPIEVNQFQQGRLDFYPYIVASDDYKNDNSAYQIGTDIFYTNGEGSEITATINPDFGQIESDSLVVNYSARETFYSDKRPFFTQSHSLFDIHENWYPGFELYSIVHTRRIGSAPDYDCSQYGLANGGSNEEELECELSEEPINDIDAAIKYTRLGEQTDIGFFGAFEHDEDFSEGKDFYAFRTLHKSGYHTIGHMITHAKSGAINRDATVNVMDYKYKPSDVITLQNFVFHSDSNQEEGGLGVRSVVTFEHNKNWRNGFEIYYFDEHLDFNDMGYMWRNDLLAGGGFVRYENTDFGENSRVLSRTYNLDFFDKNNSDNDNLKEFISLFYSQRNKNRSSFNCNLFYSPHGNDDEVTRGMGMAPFIQLRKELDFDCGYRSGMRGKWQWNLTLSSGTGDYFVFSADRKSIRTGVGYFPQDNLKFNFHLHQTKTDNWFIWTDVNQYASYESKNTRISTDMKWYPSERQEFQIKLQAVAFRNQQGQGWIADEAGYLNSTGATVESINLGKIAFQIRYKYEIAPLSNLYLVYTRGGDYYFDDEAGTSKIYRKTWDNPENNKLVLKLRIKF
jgi:hypothetical protein